jgi:hypothetical protein
LTDDNAALTDVHAYLRPSDRSGFARERCGLSELACAEFFVDSPQMRFDGVFR